MKKDRGIAPVALIFIIIGIVAVSSLAYYKNRPAETPEKSATVSVGIEQETTATFDEKQPETTSSEIKDEQVKTTPASTEPNTQSGPKIYTQAQLLALADNKYSSGSVPLGDNKYVTNGPKKGYVYLCNAHKDNPGSMVNGPWISGSSWNFLQKVSATGVVTWNNATFSNIVSGVSRILSGNGLPINHPTGKFPITSGDASKYDPNPNTISAQSLKETLPVNPVYSNTPYCMGGEVGIMLSGVPLFNGFDAGLRDAPAHEIQDSCDGHPQGSGEYHYHSLSACFKDTNVSTVLGYADDGFPITGPVVANGKYLTTEDLDECHGITSAVTIDGKSVNTYHYVMTFDFPYSASCFRGKPVTTGPSGGAPSGQQSGAQGAGQGQGSMTPPQEAISACSGKYTGSSCSFTTPMGKLSGTCKTPPNSQLACVPN